MRRSVLIYIYIYIYLFLRLLLLSFVSFRPLIYIKVGQSVTREEKEENV